MAIIDQFRGILTVFVEYEIEPAKADEVLASLNQFVDASVKGQPGFVSANLHLSLDKSRLVNYAQWKSEEDYQNYLDQVESKEDFLKGLNTKTILSKVVKAG